MRADIGAVKDCLKEAASNLFAPPRPGPSAGLFLYPH